MVLTALTTSKNGKSIFSQLDDISPYPIATFESRIIRSFTQFLTSLMVHRKWYLVLFFSQSNGQEANSKRIANTPVLLGAWIRSPFHLPVHFVPDSGSIFQLGMCDNFLLLHAPIFRTSPFPSLVSQSVATSRAS